MLLVYDLVSLSSNILFYIAGIREFLVRYYDNSEGQLRLTKKKAKLVEAVIRHWISENVATHEEGNKLLDSYEIVRFDWKRLAKYSFWISLICIVIAVCSIIADKILMELLAKIFRAPDIIKCLFLAIVAGGLYYLGIKKREKRPEKIFSNEAVFFSRRSVNSSLNCFFREGH